ncbi:signal transduction histidine kinase [Chitinivorax tropicus]|uniref:histidine kinase n=1 Tax=Chitinivorax tropicus TaxID=714531 RepID=A0A840MKB6_9PROT|nr:sensor histidine kinase [Chitinivorax tropicus]MBB5019098.1 signal transduction histidine kinase [Chitinivorax tropicus]
MLRNQKSQSLSVRAMRHMAIRIALVTVVITAISYTYTYLSYQREALTYLEKYVTVRSELESQPFINAEANTRLMRDEFVRRFQSPTDFDADKRFGELMKQDADGLWRVRVEKDDFEHKATVAILPRVSLSTEFKRKVLVAYDVASELGPAFRNQFYDAFVDINVSDATVMFLPDTNYARGGSVEVFEEDLETEVGATPKANPERKTFWTGVYFDAPAKQWMVSVVTPIDVQGRYVGGAGQDVLIDQLIERANRISVPGTYNMIVSRNGMLIAHPDKMREIEKVNGKYNIGASKDNQLVDFYRAALQATVRNPFVESTDGRYWLSVSSIKGADWLFVTVFPKALIQRKAMESASIVIVFGLMALLIEVILIGWVLREQVTNPLQGLLIAIRALARGDAEVKTHSDRNDEIGQLAREFDEMADAVAKHRTRLEELVQERTAALEQANQSLSDQNYQLEYLNREKNEFMGIAAHDLQSPINGIKGLANHTIENLDRYPKEKVLEKLSGIQNIAGKMSHLITNLLDINSLESDTYHLLLENLTVRPMVEHVVELYAAEAEEKGITVQLQVEDGLYVHVDQLAFTQIVDNLLSNAVKYSPAQTTVQIRARRDVQWVRLEVHDQGPGIAAHEMPRLFQKFARLSAKPTGDEQSIGLGLSIVKRLTEMMRGEVYCESKLGHGACFVVKLPVAEHI